MIENQSIGQIGTVILCALVCLIIKYRSLSTIELSQPGTALTQFVCFGGGSFFYPVLAIFCLLPAGFLIVSGWFFLPCNVWIWGDKIDKCTLLSQVHTCFLSWTLRFRKNYITLACMFFAQLWLIFRELSPVSPLLKHSLCPNCHVSQTLTPVKSGNHFSSKHQTVLKIPVLSSWEKLPGNISNEFSHIH